MDTTPPDRERAVRRQGEKNVDDRRSRIDQAARLVGAEDGANRVERTEASSTHRIELVLEVGETDYFVEALEGRRRSKVGNQFRALKVWGGPGSVFRPQRLL